jgi:transcriptional antiterminator RfaH
MFGIPEPVTVPAIADEATPPGPGARWFAVQCQPHRERGAAAHLEYQGFSIFLPCREKNRRHARKIETVRVPFFPGYLFIRLDLERDRWRCINGTFGVVRVVTQGERPAPAPRGIVEALIDVCGEEGLIRLQTNLTIGQRVRVAIGPFADFIGELDQLSDAGRVRVLIDLMGGRVPVLFPRSYIEPADCQP